MMRFNEATPQEIKDQKMYLDMGLTESEYAQVQQILGRDPNWTETGIFSVMWSEHCSYKHSKPFLKQFPTDGEQVLMGPGEGAGVVDIGDNQAVVFKIESHNHPSAVEPYEGAATGVGGVIRDIMSIGARPIGVLNSLRFGELDNPNNQHLLNGVVSGLAGYGNTIGAAAVSGEIEFDPSYDGNPLVNAMCVGLMTHDKMQKGTAKGIGNKVIYLGLKTGRDGIHAATFASEGFSDETVSKRPTVQMGDPFTGKKLMEATLWAIDQPELVGIQDMGAAGLTSSSSEMAAKGESGIVLNLEKVPVREAGISPYEMMLSETQERMLLVVEDGTEQKFLDAFKRFELDAAVIGEVTEGDTYLLKYEDEVYAEIPVEPLSEAPVYELEGMPIEMVEHTYDYNSEDLNAVFEELLGHPTHGDKSSLYEQLDSQAGANTVQKPGFGPGVVRVEGTDKAVAMAVDGKSRYVYADPYNGGKEVVAATFRTIISTGALPLAMTDCLNYGSPEKGEVYTQLQESTRGMAEASRALNTPVISGNVSLYNETETSSILPTPTIGMVGLIEDVSTLADRDIKPGDAVYIIGETGLDFAGSQIEKLIDKDIKHTKRNIDLDVEFSRGMDLRERFINREITMLSPIGRGGIAIKLAQLASQHNVGIEATFDFDGQLLFSETSSRYIVIAPKGLDIKDAVEVGELTADTFKLTTNTVTIEQTVKATQALWEGAIPQWMTSAE
ncbi:MAG TPA: phosphoribosylformylglycinamidine synthase subunit PurL [Aliicoccus persicus]|uniref:Phosphoribosylformylglycinamidine synthase subunit PurL n=1 Tax=Aliicoccus persicus TaxID=930138 RepID=A0A921DXX0_9STAP|nr:phosphoribosylformylglycinamidine synthase subunit PurL [Aliicoccus persicus]